MIQLTKNEKKLNFILLILVVVSAILTGIIAGSFFAFSHDLPQIEGLKSFKPSAVSRVYSADQVLLAEFFDERRDPVLLSKIPMDLQRAVIELEDRNFYKHSGVDIRGILRAIAKDFLARDFVEGASTITQQLSKTLFLNSKKTLFRKLQEAVLAFQVERRYTKDEILELYLNQVYFGSGAYGVESAANIFFGKSVNALNLSECALIAAMPRSPSRYSPVVNPELALMRRNLVLKILKDRDYITEDVYQAAIAEPVLTEKGTRNKTRAPYFIEYIKKDLEAMVGSARLYQGGLSIYTTLSSTIQDSAEISMEKHLEALEQRMTKRKTTGSPQGAVVSLNVETGGILAMVGGRNYYKSPFNRAVQAKRQPGSSFKPFVYACAIEKGYSQSRLLLDAPVSYSMGSGRPAWEPENYSKDYLGSMTLRKALALSRNIPTIRLAESLGPSAVVEFAHRAGIESPIAPDLSLALGTLDVNLLELTSAYSVFPERGQKPSVYGIESIVDRDGRLIFKAEIRKRTVMSRQNAAIVTNMLEAVIKEGTARNALSLKRPVAGKTGTTDQFKDALFVGFSPSVVTGVWVGKDDNTPLGSGESGAVSALPIWIDVMDQSFKNKPVASFDIPDGTVLISMDPDTGAQIPQGSPGSVSALVKLSTSQATH